MMIPCIYIVLKFREKIFEHCILNIMNTLSFFLRESSHQGKFSFIFLQKILVLYLVLVFYFIIYKLYCVQLICNGVLVSVVQQGISVLYLYTFPLLLFNSFPHSSLQSNEQSPVLRRSLFSCFCVRLLATLQTVASRLLCSG